MADPNATKDQVAERAKALFDKLFYDSKLGPDVRKAAKEMFPDIRIPEDTAQPMMAPLVEENAALKKQLESVVERLDKREKEETEGKQTRSMEQALEAARTKFHLTEEGFNKMVERMKEKGNFTDAEAAAAWVSGQEAPAKPTSGPSWAPQDLNLFGSKNANEDFKLLHEDTDAFFDKTVMDILNEAAA